ncbi:FBXO10 [Symbiodinium necroappetens]|uniref:FBXO10 protein n=1 Tax=Symbiodinium necroappetens TaxID=1628268 RepID=A0A813AKF2_9DINO|nr:FBXO10 [Symbiodinium necroappetens]
MDVDHFHPLLQWLRRQAVHETVSKIAPSGSFFWQHLQSLIWGCLRFAVCVPRDCPTVSEALEKLGSWPPATILISAGTYHESFVVDKPVELMGRGTSRGGSKVVFKGLQSQPIRVAVRGPAQASLQNLCLEGEGGVEVEGGSVLLKCCTVSLSEPFIVKGKSSATLQESSFVSCRRTALILRDETEVKFNSCTFEGNLNVCISAREQASVTVSDCVLQRNAAPVMQFRDTVKVQVERTGFRCNNGCGVLVRGQASASIESCEMRGQKMAAVAYQHNATGRLLGNVMQENDGAVVLISGTASVQVEDNTMTNNGKTAPVIEFSSASGTVRAKVVSKREDSQNQLTHKLAYISGEAGEEWVDVDEQRKILRNKTGQTNIPYKLQQPMRAGHADDGEGGTLNGASLARGTKRCVIAVRDAAQATIRNNRIEGNAGYGILVSEQASPVIEGNFLSACRCSAIHVDGTSSARISQNSFTDNHAAGIDVRGEASPTIEENKFRGHTRQAIRAADKSACIIRGNSLSSNDGHAVIITDFACPRVEQNVMESDQKPAMLVRSPLGTYSANEEVERGARERRTKRRREPDCEEAQQKEKAPLLPCGLEVQRRWPISPEDDLPIRSIEEWHPPQIRRKWGSRKEAQMMRRKEFSSQLPARACLGNFSFDKPPEPASEVVELLQDMKITPRLVMQFFKTFKRLKRFDSITLRVGPDEVSTASMTRLVKNHRQWVAKIMILLLDLAGYKDTVTWDGFLYVTMQFCALSKLELCQVMFYVVCKEMKSWTVHYLTSSQLEEFYDDYYTCPVHAFNTNSINFAKLPLAKFRMQDFIELCYRYSQLINPCMHLQRSLQQSLPSLRFWSNYDKIKVYNRRITIDFFRFQKVTSLLELMRRHAGTGVGPVQQHRLNVMDQFMVLEKSNPGFKDDIEKFKAAVLKAMEKCRPTKSGLLPLPMGVHPPAKVRLVREMRLPEWMHRHLETNQAPGVHGGHALGHAAQLEANNQEKVIPSMASSSMPRSVEEAEALVRSTFGEIASRSKVKQIAANLFQHAAKPPSEDSRLKSVVRSQELEFIRMSRQDVEPPNLVRTMQRLFQEELMDRTPKEAAI